MKIVNPLRTARLIEQRIAKLGPNPSCFDCGEMDIACLEQDHPVGEDRDKELKQVVCRNCHRKREWKRDRAGLTTNGQHKKETLHEAHYRYLMLLADNHEEIAASLRREAEKFKQMEGTKP